MLDAVEAARSLRRDLAPMRSDRPDIQPLHDRGDLGPRGVGGGGAADVSGRRGIPPLHRHHRAWCRPSASRSGCLRPSAIPTPRSAPLLQAGPGHRRGRGGCWDARGHGGRPGDDRRLPADSTSFRSLSSVLDPAAFVTGLLGEHPDGLGRRGLRAAPGLRTDACRGHAPARARPITAGAGSIAGWLTVYWTSPAAWCCAGMARQPGRMAGAVAASRCGHGAVGGDDHDCFPGSTRCST